MRVPFRTPAVVLAVLLAAASVAHAQANFAGTWVLDPSQSQLPRHHHHKGAAAPDAQGQPPARTLTVDQTGDVLKATRSVKRGNTERSFSVTYTLNGAEETTTGWRNSTVVTRAAWDGPRLVVSANRTVPRRSGGEVQLSRESVWALSPDGRTLTIQTTLHGPRGDRSFTHVYQRA